MGTKKRALRSTNRKGNVALGFWTRLDVQNWLKQHRYLAPMFAKYGKLFNEHNVTGQILSQLNEGTLLAMGICNEEDRTIILRHVSTQKLKSDLDELNALMTGIEF